MHNPYDPVEPGSFFLLMNQIATLINASVIYVNDERLNLRKYSIENGGYITEDIWVKMRQLDVGLIMYTKLLNAKCAYCVSTFIINDVYSGILLPPRRRIPKWKEFKVFSNELILATVISILVSGYVYALLTQQSLLEAAFQIYRLCFQLSLDSLPQNWKMRIYFMLLMFFIMEISAAYLSCLSGVFTRPSLEPKITTLEEFVESDIPLIGAEHYINWIKGQIEPRPNRRPFPKGKFRVGFVDDNIRWVTIEGYAVMTALFPSTMKAFQLRLLPLSDRNIAVFLYRKNFHLQELIDNHIRRIDQSGLLDIFMAIKPRTLVVHEMVRILNVEDLSMVFIIWLCGLAISAIVFTYEIIHFKREQKLAQIRRRLMSN